MNNHDFGGGAGGRPRKAPERNAMDDEPLTPTPFDALTDKEQEIYALVQQQFTHHQIAVSLHITENTLKTHMKHIRQKLDSPPPPLPSTPAGIRSPDNITLRAIDSDTWRR